MSLTEAERVSLGKPPRNHNERQLANSMARVVLAVASGATSVREIMVATGIESPSTAHNRAREAIVAGWVRDLADEFGSPRSGNTYRSALRITQLARELRPSGPTS